MAKGLRQPGEFCWINMVTPRPGEAREFFGTLLGWTYFEMPGIGHGVKVGGHDVGGLFDLDGPNTPPGTRPVLGVMVKVESVDVACEKAKSLGGIVKVAMDIFDQGRMAVLLDPLGANIDVWEPRKMPGTDADPSNHGAPSWFENLTTDVPRATDFYARLFGWMPEVQPMDGFEYTVFKLGDAPVAGLMEIMPEMGSIPPHWGTYFTVDDVDATAEEAVRLGATLCVPAQDIPGVGRFCGIISPQGIPFCVITYTR
jgi:predicted enzyme related to lactoylglutathione lyase